MDGSIRHVAAKHRHSPYTRNRHSATDTAIRLYQRISRPFLARSPLLNPDTDAFSVPWRTEEREITDLKEELRRVQQEAEQFDARQNSLSAPFEAVFDTARKLADEQSASESHKGKELDVDSDKAALASASAGHSVSGWSANEQAVLDAGYEDGEDLEDIDYVPDAEPDDDEEEVLQLDLEPIDESEEVTAGDGVSQPVRETPEVIISLVQPPKHITDGEPSSESEEAVAEESEEAPASDDNSVSESAPILEEVAEESGPVTEAEAEGEDVVLAEQDTEDASQPELELIAEAVNEPDTEQSSEESIAAAETEGSVSAEVEEENEDEDEDEDTSESDQVSVDVVMESDTDKNADEDVDEPADENTDTVDSDQVTDELVVVDSDSLQQSSEDEGEETDVIDADSESADESQSYQLHGEAEPTQTEPRPAQWSLFRSVSSFLGQIAASAPSYAQQQFQRQQQQPEHGDDQYSSDKKIETGADSEYSATAEEVGEVPDYSEQLVYEEDLTEELPGEEPCKQEHGRSSGVRESMYSSLKRQINSTHDTEQLDRSHRQYSPVAALTAAESSLRSPEEHRPFPHVPRTFLDMSQPLEPFEKRFKITSKASTSQGHTSVPKSPVKAVPAPASKSMSDQTLFSTKITPESLGLPPQRGSVRTYSKHLPKKTKAYYGSGYGMRSLPYVFRASRSAPAHPTTTTTTGTGVSAVQPDEAEGSTAPVPKGSITAQKILDIIGDIPPVRAQAMLEIHNMINPYENASPQPVRVGIKSSQRRRELVPASARLPEVHEKPSSADAGNKTVSILESIRSAAPPEIQSLMAKSRDKVAAATPESRIGDKKAEVPGMPPFVAAAPAKASSVKAAVSTPPTAVKSIEPVVATQPAFALSVKKTQVPAAPAKPQPVTVRALAISQSQLPRFSFDLQVLEPLKTSAKRKISQMDASELPVFDFVVGVKKRAVDQPKPASIKSPSVVSSPWGQPVAAKAGQWKCGVCDLMSPDSAGKCIVCDAPKPESAPAAVSAPSATPVAPKSDLWSQPALSADEWKCSVCDCRSPQSSDKCVVCETPKPGPAPAAVSAPAPAAFPAAPKADLWSQPTPAKAGQWKCGVCDLMSPDSADKCIVCDAPKPESAPAAVSAPAATTTVPKNDLWSQPALSADEWKCSVCDCRSPQSSDKCVVCETPKPGSVPAAVSAPAPAAFPAASKTDLWGKPAAAKTGQWKCGVCDLMSPDSADKCTICEAPKPRSAPAAVSAPAATTTVPKNDLWSQPAAAKTGQWKCGVCDLMSPDSADKCTICEAPKPGSTQASATSKPQRTAKPLLSPKDRVKAFEVSKLPSFGFDLDVKSKPTPPFLSSGFGSPASTDSGNVFQSAALVDGEWNCALCGLKNAKVAGKCMVCGTAKK